MWLCRKVVPGRFSRKHSRLSFLIPGTLKSGSMVLVVTAAYLCLPAASPVAYLGCKGNGKQQSTGMGLCGEAVRRRISGKHTHRGPSAVSF